MSDDLLAAVDRIKGLIVPLLQGQSAAELGRVLVYVQSVPRSLDASRAALRALEEKEGEETDPDRDEQERRKKRAAIEQACRRGCKTPSPLPAATWTLPVCRPWRRWCTAPPGPQGRSGEEGSRSAKEP